MKKVNFFNYCLLIALGMATVAFNAYGQSSTSDKGIVINGVKWATRNVAAPGTFADKPEDPGMFYQWNSKIGWSATDPMINSYGGTTWKDDAPGNIWGEDNDPSPTGWRVPTLEEFETLFDTDNVSIEWGTTQNGITGRKFTDKTSGNSIFLPAAGYRASHSGTLNVAGLIGKYWSSTTTENDGDFADEEYYQFASYLEFHSEDAYCNDYNFRYNGLSVRAVANTGIAQTAIAQESKTYDEVLFVDDIPVDSVSAIIDENFEGDNIIFHNPTASTTDEEGVIINGVKWATRNVSAPGTFADKPEDPGMFYVWNSKIGWSATDPMINSNGDTAWAWDSAGDTWGKVNDPSPSGWRVPTLDEIKTLLDTDKVSQEWKTAENGLKGIKFTDKTSGNSIFLLAVGSRYCIDGTLEFAGLSGYYWSSTLSDINKNAYSLCISRDSANWSYWYDSRNGQSVRVVAE